MTWSEFQEGVEKTLNPALSERDRLASAVIGLASEVGEIAEPIKHYLYQGHLIDDSALANLVEEMGDLLYYLGLLANCLNLDLEEIAARNQRKLQRRYPHGFEVERSVNREVGV